jgi:tol-pal system protein YbgF
MNKATTVKAAALLVLASSWTQVAAVPVIEITETAAAPLAGGGVRPLPVQQGSGMSLQNEFLFTLQQLQDEVRMLRGALEEQQHKVDRLEQQQRDRYRDMDRRISLLMAALPDDALLKAQQAQTADTAADTAAAVPQAETEAPASSAAVDSVAYEAAFAHVRQREHVQAEEAFDRFVKDYPDSALIPNAWYWLGEVKLAQGKSEAAASAFDLVLTRYPRHAKAADALYKLGVLTQRGGDSAGAVRLMQRVQNEYPQSSAAGLARSFLSTQQ